MRSAFVWAAAATAVLLAISASSLGGGMATGSITVMVRAGDGTNTPVGGAMVMIVGSQIGAMTNNQGKAHISNILPGKHTVSVRRIGFCASSRIVTVVDGADVQLTMYTCPQVDALTVDGFDDPIMAVLYARMPDGGSGACKRDVVRTGNGGFLIPENTMALTAGTSTCDGAAIVFSGNRALSFMDDAASLPWTDAGGDVYDVVRPPRRLRVPISLWMSTTTEDKTVLTDKMLNVHLLRANTILTQSMTGMVLVADVSSDAPPTTVGDADAVSGAKAAIGSGCANVAKIKAKPEIYDPARLNVYYVDDITSGGSLGGHTCTVEGARNIIFIDDNQIGDHLLAHEIGHALGLDRPAWGHTQALGGFYADGTPDHNALNVMNELADAPNYFSLGQAARMNLNDSSWVNVSDATGSLRSLQAAVLGAMPVFACGCPEDNEPNHCPAMNRDIVRTSDPIVKGNPLACVVVPTATSASVNCNSTVNVSAKLTVDGTTNAYPGSAKWTAEDPTIVSVALGATPLGTMNGTVTGLKAGSTKVRAWAGGTSSVPITITVHPSSSCPTA